MIYSCKEVITACPFVKPRVAYVGSGKSYIKSQPQEFRKWKAKHQELFDQKVIVPIKNNPRWGKIAFGGQDPKIICLDPNSYSAGNIYNAYSKDHLYVIHAISLLGRPIHAAVMTIFHGTVGWVKVIYEGVKNNETAKQIGQRVFKELADVVRTPLYNVLLMIVQVASVIFSPFKPTLLYDFRAIIDRLSHELLWGNRYDFDNRGPQDLTPCQRRLANIMDFEKNGKDTLEALQTLRS